MHTSRLAGLTAEELSLRMAWPAGRRPGVVWGVHETEGVCPAVTGGGARAVSPAGAGKDAYASLDGGLAVAVPMELKGLHAAWSRYGSKPWQRRRAAA